MRGSCASSTFNCRDPDAAVDTKPPSLLYVPKTLPSSRQIRFHSAWPTPLPGVVAQDNFPCFDYEAATVYKQELTYVCSNERYTTGIPFGDVIFTALRTWTATDNAGNVGTDSYVIEVLNDIVDPLPPLYPVMDGPRACLSPANRRYYPFTNATTTNPFFGWDTVLGALPRSLLAYGATLAFISCVSDYWPEADLDDVPECIYDGVSDTVWVSALGGPLKADNKWTISFQYEDECGGKRVFVVTVNVYDTMPRSLPVGVSRCIDMKTGDQVLDSKALVLAKLEEAKEAEKVRIDAVRLSAEELQAKCVDEAFRISHSRCRKSIRDTLLSHAERESSIAQSSTDAVTDHLLTFGEDIHRASRGESYDPHRQIRPSLEGLFESPSFNDSSPLSHPLSVNSLSRFVSGLLEFDVNDSLDEKVNQPVSEWDHPKVFDAFEVPKDTLTKLHLDTPQLTLKQPMPQLKPNVMHTSWWEEDRLTRSDQGNLLPTLDLNTFSLFTNVKASSN
eukprot:GHVR01012701.1.p1 GENE.GHVR01012701.1~~GHVR01012701.1.p1  ORF type:complete len:504 (-),score=112.99 GHVR01012701.1:247-1758(-)